MSQQSPDAVGSPENLLPDDWYTAFRGWVRAHLAIDFSAAQRRNLSAGIARALHESGSPNYAAYWQRLHERDHVEAEVDRLARLLTVTETYFFRDDFQIRALRTTILPRLIAAHQHNRTLRIWSAGCATGEEPYTLAILLDELLPDGGADWQLSIFGTDINHEVLACARRGVYRSGPLRELSAAQVARYFTEVEDGYQLHESILERVHFAPLNLIAPVYPEPFAHADFFDLIICRNVLIYFAPPEIKQVVTQLYNALSPDGFFLSGQVEPVRRAEPRLRPEMIGETLAYRKGLPPAPLVKVPRHAAPPPALLPLPLPPRPPAAAIKPRPPTKALPAIPSSPFVPKMPTAYEQALNAANLGHWAAALTFCEQAIKANPVDALAYQLLGLVHEALGDYAQAGEALRRAIYLEPGALLSHFYLANLYHQRQDGREARAWTTLYRLLEKRPPDEVIAGSAGMTVHYLLGLIGPLLAASQSADKMDRSAAL